MKVTFAVGGVGEYIDNMTITRDHDHCSVAENNTDSSLESQSCHLTAVSSESADFVVTTNAVVVNKASPHAIANAVYHLIMNDTLRDELGQAGKKTVHSYFHVDRQMKQYRKFYVDLIQQYRSYFKSKV